MKRILASLSVAGLLAGLVLVPAFASSENTKQKGEKPLKISHGEMVTLADYLVPGKTTVFDFTSQYCPPCQRISPLLDKLHAAREDIAVVKVDINRPDVQGIDWRSPVARQYALSSIPHFKVYGPDGTLVAEDNTEDAKARAMVLGWIDKLQPTE